MAIQLACPSCQARLSLTEAHQGKRIRCPKCKRPLTVGRPAAAIATPASQPIPNRSSTLPLLFILGAVLLLGVVGGAGGMIALGLLNPAGDTGKGATTVAATANGRTEAEVGPKNSRPTAPAEQPKESPPPSEPPTKPVALARPKKVALPAPAADMVVGGAGKYLVVLLPTKRQAAVVSVPDLRVQHFIPLKSETARVAAGRDKLVVANFEGKKLQRWRLDREEMELEVPLPADHPGVGHALMGSASHGPVLLGRGPKLLDLQTLQPLPVTITPAADGTTPAADLGLGARVSADGKVFAFWKRRDRPQQAFSLVVSGSEATCYTTGETAGHVAPNANGSTLYSGRGLFTNRVESVNVRHLRVEYCVPAQQAGYWFVVKELRDPKCPIALYRDGEDQPFATLTDLEHPPVNEWDDEDFCADRRMVFLPQYHLFVTMPKPDQLVFHPVDVAALSAK